MAEEGALLTPRLILRPPAADDLPWLLAVMNTAEVLRHLGGVPRPAEAVAQDLDADIADFAAAQGHLRWTVWRRDSTVRVGRCGLGPLRSPVAPPDLRGQYEIGWSLAPEHWGKGYAAEAARAVLAHAFGPLGIAQVFAQTSDSNAPSTRLMQRLGFTARPELGYVDPDYPPRDNPTTVWSMDAPPPNRNA